MSFIARCVLIVKRQGADKSIMCGYFPNFAESFRKSENTMFKTPPITKNLIIINLIIFLAKYVFNARGIDLDQILGLHFFMASDFHLYQLVSYMFMHANIEHIFFNMFSLWMFGRIIEQTWGAKKYLAFFMICGIGAGLTQELWQLGQYYVEGLHDYEMVNTGDALIPMGEYLNMWTTIGASGACYAVMLAFGMTYPNETLVLFPIPIPLKAKYFVMICVAIELFSSFSTNGNVAHFAHLGGMAFAWFLIKRNRRHGGGFGGWEEYTPKRDNFFKRMRDKMTADKQEHYDEYEPYDERRKDYDYNSQREDRQREIDRILDKIRSSGYASLSEEEKRKLFDAGDK